MEKMEIVKQELGLSLQQPKRFYAELLATTLNEIANTETPAISTIARNHGGVVAKSLLIIALDDVINYFNVTNNFTDGQLNQTVDLIMEKFYWMKPEDFKLCFNQAKMGKYGATYNRLDGSVVFEWLNQYDQERAEFFMNLRPKENFSPAIRTNDTKEIRKLYDQVLTEEIKRKETAERKEELRQLAIEEWHRDYRNHFTGIEITADLHEAYIAKFPLNESYINYFIKKNI